MKIGYIGLGKMGLGMVTRMKEKGHNVIAYNRSEGPRKEAQVRGVETVSEIKEMVSMLETPRTIWLMVPSKVVDEVLSEVYESGVEEGDTIIDGGNSNYKETIERSKRVHEKKLRFLDAGVSGGPSGAINGACIMVGGEKEVYDKYANLFADLSVPKGSAYMGKHGAGHFVKMVHNGIEYGMMQAIAEGMEVLKKSEFDLDMNAVASLYNHGSVIESRLVGWLENAYREYSVDLEGVSGSVAHTGEGEWTVEAAKELGVPVPIIEGAYKFRLQSDDNPSYTGQVLSALRNQFGGHSIEKK